MSRRWLVPAGLNHGWHYGPPDGEISAGHRTRSSQAGRQKAWERETRLTTAAMTTTTAKNAAAARSPRSIELGSVLVIGGCGFVGTHIVDQLLNFPSEDPSVARKPVLDADGNPDLRFKVPSLRGRYPEYKNTKVSVLDLKTTNNRMPGADYYEGDIMSEDSLIEIFAKVKPDVVIHTVSPPMLEGNKEMLRTVNIDGTRNLLHVAGGEVGDWGGVCKAFVYTSSSSVVHDTKSDLINVDERWPYVTGELQEEYYTETKALAEELVLLYNEQSPSKMLTCAVRPAGIFGERDTTLTRKLLEHGSSASDFVLKMQLGENTNLFDFTYVGNVALCHMLAAEALLATKKRQEDGLAKPLDYERVDGEAFNVTNDSPIYFWDMAHAVWGLIGRYVEPGAAWALPEGVMLVLGGVLEQVFGLFGKQPKLKKREVRYSCMTRYYSCDKAKARLKYAPVVSVDEGARRAVGFVLDTNAGIAAKKAE
ncbi:erg26, C-3 sterol dehydrogenase [Ascosphaera acerosa]|nr:erg26, C-3 sterol dehydrogenase [Ascosphaera acerosa]